jgi:hypothetical protein
MPHISSLCPPFPPSVPPAVVGPHLLLPAALLHLGPTRGQGWQTTRFGGTVTVGSSSRFFFFVVVVVVFSCFISNGSIVYRMIWSRLLPLCSARAWAKTVEGASPPGKALNSGDPAATWRCWAADRVRLRDTWWSRLHEVDAWLWRPAWCCACDRHLCEDWSDGRRWRWITCFSDRGPLASCWSWPPSCRPG